MSRPADKPGPVLPGVAAPGSAAQQTAIRSSVANLPMVFEPNLGQADPQVSFLARGGGYTLFLTRREAVVALSGSAPIRIRPTCAQEPQAIDGLEPTGGISNYFIGNDPARWTTRVPNYRKVQYTGVCPGVDVTYYGNPQKLEYDFTLAAWTDPRTVQVEYEGAESVRVAANGDLLVKTASGELVQHKPRAYQVIGGRQVQVEAGYRVTHGNSVEFALARYNRQQPLVIDPVLVYSTYLGGSGGDSGLAIAADSAGNAYVTGRTQSVDFPTTIPRQARYAGGLHDAFVAKISADGSTKLYATYLGGENDDVGYGIAVDASGNAYVTGQTNSTLFPVANAFQQSLSASSDAFVTKLSPTGSALLYSTFLGGAGAEQGAGIAVDSNGNAYVTGFTDSANFPTTPLSFQPIQALGNIESAFVAKFDATGARVYSTYLGGNKADLGTAIAVDTAGNAYVTGSATSTNFPTSGAFQGGIHAPLVNPQNAQNAFVTKLNANGNGLVFSTYLGGTGGDHGTGIAVDTNGNTYVTGAANSTDFPTQSPLFAANAGGASDAFVTKLNPAGSLLLYSTYLGGLGTDLGNGIAVDSSGTAYVVGSTTSSNFPTQNALFTTGFIFVAALNPAGNGFSYSTFLSGAISDAGNGIAVTPTGKAYVTGFTNSTSFPTLNAVQPTLGGGNNGPGNAFVTVISAGIPTANSVTPSSGTGTSQTFSYTVSSAGGAGNIAGIYTLLNTVISGASACHFFYNPASNLINLIDDAGGLSLPSAVLGTAGSRSNSQCTLNTGASSATTAGNNLTLNLALTFSTSFVGPKNNYLYVADRAGQTSGWVQVGTWTTSGVAAPPVAASVTPASGTGTSQTFSYTVSSAGGAGNIAGMYTLLNTVISGASACHFFYNPASNLITMVDDAGGLSLPAAVLGTAGSRSNSQCTLNTGASSATTAGNNLTLNLALTFSTSFVGPKNNYLYVADRAGQTSGWVQVGNWTTSGVAAPPVAASVTPASGTGTSQTFSYTVSSAGGAANIAGMYTLLNTVISGVSACHFFYNPASNLITLIDDAGGLSLPSAVLGTAGSRSNSQCTLNTGASSATTAGNSLTLNLALTFSTSFVGAKNNYLWVSDRAGQSSGWVQSGTWTTSAATPPVAVSVSPASGTGLSQLFSYTVSSAGGAGNIGGMYTLLNTVISGAGACHFFYNPASNLITLIDDAGGLSLPSAVLGTAGSRSNSQCTLNTGASSATTAGNNLTLNLALTFSTNFVGTKNNYLWVSDRAGQISGWTLLGTWIP